MVEFRETEENWSWSSGRVVGTDWRGYADMVEAEGDWEVKNIEKVMWSM